MRWPPIFRRKSPKEIRLADLVSTDDWTVSGHKFENCDIWGPAVLVLLRDVEISNCTWKGTPDSLFWELSPGRKSFTGAIGVRDMAFRRCRFHGVGLAGNEAQIRHLRGSFRNLQRVDLHVNGRPVQ